MFVLAHLFVKLLRPEDSEVILSVFEASCHQLLPIQPLKGRGIPLSALPKDTSSKLPAYLHTIPLMLNVKQGSCKYQLFKSFGLTRSGKRTQVYRLRGRRSNNAPMFSLPLALLM